MAGNMSPLQLAKRALVTLILLLGRQYNIPLTLTRDADDKLVLTAFKKILLRVHPDKGGSERREKSN